MFQLHLRCCKVSAVSKARGYFVNCTLWTTQPSCWIWTCCKRLMGRVRHLVVGFDAALQPGNFLSNQFGDVLLDGRSGEKRLGSWRTMKADIKGAVCLSNISTPSKPEPYVYWYSSRNSVSSDMYSLSADLSWLSAAGKSFPDSSAASWPSARFRLDFFTLEKQERRKRK